MIPGPKNDEVELDLPALDGEEAEGEQADLGDDLPAKAHEEDGGDPFDDAAFGGKDAGEEELDTLGTEGGWLEDAEVAGALDIGAIDLSIQAEGNVLDDAEPDHAGGLDDLIQTGEEYVADAGEEGPLADDEELREEDLPALDADDDGDVPDDALFDRSTLGGEDELRWADRAWTAAEAPTASELESAAEESGMLAVPGDDPRDHAWKALEDTGRVMGAAFVPGDAVVLALASPDRARAFLVRITASGEQRIIAEVDPRDDDDGSSCEVTQMRWHVPTGCLVVVGSFGIHAYRPA